MTFDPVEQLRVLVQEEVEFVIVGGIAAAALGSPTATVDLDICYRRTPENMDNLARALRRINARLRDVDPSLPFILDGSTIAGGDSFTFTTDLGDLDILGTPSGTGGFDDLDADAQTVDIDGLSIRIVALDDLIRMKRAAGRAKDRAELEILGALREELER